MTQEAPHPLQRRAHVRQPILLPVRLSFLGGTKQGAALAKFGSVFALALDVSPGGMQLVVSGTVARHVLGDFEVGCAVQIGFVHVELRAGGDRIARVRWARAADDRNECLLGVEFDKPLAAPNVREIIERGALTAGSGGAPYWSLAAALGAAVVLGGLWFSSKTSARESELSAQKAEAALTECTKSESEQERRLEDCRKTVERSLAERPTSPDAKVSPDAGDTAAPPHE